MCKGPTGPANLDFIPVTKEINEGSEQMSDLLSLMVGKIGVPS